MRSTSPVAAGCSMRSSGPACRHWPMPRRSARTRPDRRTARSMSPGRPKGRRAPSTPVTRRPSSESSIGWNPRIPSCGSFACGPGSSSSARPRPRSAGCSSVRSFRAGRSPRLHPGGSGAARTALSGRPFPRRRPGVRPRCHPRRPRAVQHRRRPGARPGRARPCVRCPADPGAGGPGARARRGHLPAPPATDGARLARHGPGGSDHGHRPRPDGARLDPQYRATDALLELLDGLRRGDGYDTPAARARDERPRALRELLTGVGARQRYGCSRILIAPSCFFWKIS